MKADPPAADLAEALAARLCHDLAGLAGTVAGMLELAGSDPAQAQESLPVAREAASRLLRRLMVARAAFGGLDAWPQTALSGLLASLASQHHRVDLDPQAARLCRDPASGRLLLNVAILGGELLQGRGDVLVRHGPGRGLSVTLAAAPGRLSPDWPAPAVADLAEPRLFQRGWTALIAASHGARLQPEGAILRIELPV